MTTPRAYTTVMNAIRDPTRSLAKTTLTRLQVELGATPVTTLRVVAARAKNTLPVSLERITRVNTQKWSRTRYHVMMIVMRVHAHAR